MKHRAPCSRAWEIDPYREGRLGARDAKSFERHLRICGDCRAQADADERLRTLARALPVAGPSALALRRVRGRVLRDSATGVAPRPPSRWRVVGVAAGIAVASVAAWGVVARRPAPSAAAVTAAAPPAASVAPAAASTDVDAPAGAVIASADARWSQARAQGVEQITLDDGTLRVHVRAQVVGERFLVMLPDGELEVRGTTFEVNVAHGATTRVHVDEGVVELRLRGALPRRLRSAETWTALAVAAALQPAPSPSPRSSLQPRRAAPSAVPPATAPVAENDGYTAAMGLLRSGRNDEAAAAFHAYGVGQPGAPQAEDASFLEAVALARAGRADAAALAAEHHLARFPDSFHGREAAILVARAAVQRGDCARAKAVLAAWTGDGHADADAVATLRDCRGR